MFATIARFCVGHRRGVLAAWILLILMGDAASLPLSKHLTNAAGGSSESARGASILDRASPVGPGAVILVQGAPVDAAATRARVAVLTAKVDRLPQVTGTVNAYTSPDPRLRARDGRASLIVVSLRKNASTTDQSSAVAAMRADARGAVPGARVLVGGDAAVTADMNSSLQHDLFMGALVSFPILLIALLFIFGGLRAALLPVIGAFATMTGALLALLGISYLTSLSQLVLDVVLLFGLALAVDYGLLMVNRFRETRAAGADITGAVEHTGAIAGRTVAFSALTVATALSGLLVFGDPTFTSVAISGIATVLFALATALTLIPALLAAWGARLTAARRQRGEDRFFFRLARRIQRRPWLAAVGVSAVLVAVALPFLHANYGNSDPRTLPLASESRHVALALAADFPGMRADPISIVARIPASDPRIPAYAAKLAHQPGAAAVSLEHLHGNVAAIDVTPAGITQGATAQHLVATLRAHRPHFQTWVTGSAASLVDFKNQITQRLPYALTLIVLATFILLFLVTGSVLIPVKALVMNTLSLGAVFGALVWVFQDGHLSHLLGFQPFGTIEAWVPVVVFVFAFGLSMDYEVFLLSRITEAHDEGRDTNHAVATGLQRSGWIITSAAFLVLIVFLGFAAGHSLGVKEFGLALAVAVAHRRHPGPLHPGARNHDPARPGELVGSRPVAAPAPLHRPTRNTSALGRRHRHAWRSTVSHR
ncbi:MAG TPA: MMPL family transporter [Streptosporangiaceae bacterium]|nr:MMPL family transporter [Streptosporangiaceae bacterium]